MAAISGHRATGFPYISYILPCSPPLEGRTLHSQECPLPPLEGRALHSQECFLPPRGGFNLRCTRERYIPKNVFFLRGEDLIYDAPESAYIPKNVSFLREEVLIYDVPSLPRKDNRFDQEIPSIRGSKVWRKGSRPVGVAVP